MSRKSILSGGVRATIAVVALYALVLQAFLAGFAPVGGAATAHGVAELCAPLQDDGGAPTKQVHKSCCTLACSPLAVPATDAPVATVAWPHRRVVAVTFAAAPPLPPRGPPVHAHSPRGPPAA